MSKPPRPAELPILTRAESELMAAFWENGPLTVTALVEKLGRKVAYNTALTTVRILETKGYVTHEAAPEGRAFLYRSAVPAEKARKHHARDLVDRLFAGRARELVTGLLSEETLSRDELSALRAEIDAKLSRRNK